MDGSLSATDGWFATPESQVSAHFGVGLDGAVVRYVAPADRAWANGIREPGNRWDAAGLPDENPNELTCSIETEDNGNAGQPVTAEQYMAVRALVRMIQQEFPSVRYLLGHDDISPASRAHCPGARWRASGRVGQLARDTGLEVLS